MQGTGWTNSSTAQISGGGTMKLAGTYTNSGSIRVTGSTLDLAGSFTLANLGTFSADGSSTVRILGTLTNTTLDLSSTSSAWHLAGGSIVGGSVTNGTLQVTAGSSLDGVQMDADLTIGDQQTLTIANDLTLNGTLTMFNSNFNTYLNFPGSQSLLGTGEVVFVGPWRGNTVRSTSATLTIGASMTIRGHAGFVGWPGTSFVNNGTIRSETSGWTMVLDGTGWDNQNTVEAVSGAWIDLQGTGWTNSSMAQISGGGTMKLAGTYTNSGSITVTGSTLDLADAFTLANVGSFSADGSSTVRILGTLTNTTLDLSSTSSAWHLAGGSIVGGSVTNGTLQVTAASSLDGVQMDADLTIGDQQTLTIANDLTLNGTLTMFNSNFNTYLNFPGSQSLLGMGEVVFVGPWRGNTVRSTSATLTIGSDMTIRGHAGFVGWPGTSFVNNGTIRSETSGWTMVLDGTGWSNASGATIAADGGNVSADGTWSNAGTVAIDHQSSFFSTSGYTQTAGGKLSVELGGTATNLYGTLEVTGTATLDGELEVTTESFSPTTGNTFQAVTSSNASGTFSTEPAGFTTSYNSPGAGDVTIQAL